MEGSPEIVPVIGIGASAGGLEALKEFFGGQSEPTGMAFVVVQHLDPTHESLMAQLIERHTSMDVTQAAGGEQLIADHVYVIPPGHGLALEDNALQLTEFTDPRGFRRPIDDFFESLAQNRGTRAACVILSGTGADGTRGLRAIKEQGGLAIAQDPDTARYDGMPVSAIGTGLIDFVAAPGEVIERLRHFFGQEPFETVEDEAREVAGTIDNLCEAIREAVGHDFSGYKHSTISRRIARRMQVLGITDSQEYLERVRSDEQECDALFRDLLINVTRFFRDRDEFESLRKNAIDEIMANADDGQEIRVWVPGCSSGEEAYSIAMMFASAKRRFDKRPYIQIFATDIDDKMLQIARNATYPLAEINDIPSEYRGDYTLGGSDTFTIAPKIRDMVRFSLHNLVRDPPFSNIDLISCRNLLIYFDEGLQKQALPLFHFSLRNDTGFLFLGSSEAIGRFDDLFEVVDQPSRIFRRKNVRSRYSLKVTGRARDAKRRQRDDQNMNNQPRTNSVELAALKRIAESYAPVSLLVDAEGVLLERWGKAGKFLNFPDRLERNIHVPSLARPGLREIIGPMLREARTTGRKLGTKDVRVRNEFGEVPVSVVCEPVDGNSFLFIVRESGAMTLFEGEDFDEFDREDGQLQFLEEELQSTRHRLRSTVEELETTNEELKSSNEEMMSMNEELQSTNEELTTVNDELNSKVGQLTVANSDLRNFFDSTELSVVVVNADLTVRSFTDAARSLFTIEPEDIDRPLAEIPTRLRARDYLQLARDVIEHGKSEEYRATTSTNDADFFARIVPYRDIEGIVEGATLVFTDVTDILALEADLKEERERLRLALEVAQVGIWEYEPATDKTVLDATERRLLEIEKEDAGDLMAPILARIPEEDRARVNTSLRQAIDGGADFDETFRIPLNDGGHRWLHGLGRRIMTGGHSKFIGVTYDISAEREVLEQRDMMIREMNHRVKNLFAIISAMISICAREVDNIQEFAEDLRARIHALGRSHSLTSDRGQETATTLSTLIETVVLPTLENQKLTTKGDPVEIPVSQITSLALIFHEWATNATKYGALSVEDGAISVSWQRTGNELAISWRETGGNDSAEDGAGFGTRMIEATARQLRGTVSGVATDDGFERKLTFDVD